MQSRVKTGILVEAREVFDEMDAANSDLEYFARAVAQVCQHDASLFCQTCAAFSDWPSVNARRD